MLRHQNDPSLYHNMTTPSRWCSQRPKTSQSNEGTKKKKKMCALWLQVSMNGGRLVLPGRIWSTVRSVQRSPRCWRSQTASKGRWLCGGDHSLSCWRSEVNTGGVGCDQCQIFNYAVELWSERSVLLVPLKIQSVSFLFWEIKFGGSITTIPRKLRCCCYGSRLYI